MKGKILVTLAICALCVTSASFSADLDDMDEGNDSLSMQNLALDNTNTNTNSNNIMQNPGGGDGTTGSIPNAGTTPSTTSLNDATNTSTPNVNDDISADTATGDDDY